VVSHARLDTRIAAVRRFNRFYTRQIGLLRKSYLGSPFSLAEMRVLYEIAHADRPNATNIARKLDLDAGYLSRVLRNFENRGLVSRARSKADARQSHLALSAGGRRTFDPIDRRSQREVGSMLAKLSNSGQTRLLAAMHRIEELLGGESEPATGRAYVLRAPKPGDFGWIVARHAVLYAQDYRWTGPFEGLCAQIVADYVNKHEPQRERCWIAEADGENVGSVMLVKDSNDVARIRMLLVEPKARGLGIGVRLVEECVSFARKARYRKVTLWTHSVLTTARNIYERAGFKLVASQKHNSWGRQVIGETWDLAL
jgi:DNA-binding MarR family transcriptional regulator/N-acetylglutamate synthase-like GNAT family acetyltransferase